MALLGRFGRALAGAGPGRRVWLAAALVLVAALPGSAQTAGTREYQLKAVFLFNFAQFTEWPATAFADPQVPLVIGVLGDDPFGRHLDEVVQGETIGARALVVQRYRTAGEIGPCHILFISPSVSAQLEDTLALLKDRSILTVCDTEGFGRRGVMIRFLNDRGKIRLRINLDAAKAAGLTLSSKLLRPAEIITTGKD